MNDKIFDDACRAARSSPRPELLDRKLSLNIGHAETEKRNVSVYLENFRLAGQKPWGGFTADHSFKITLRDLCLAIPDLGEALEERDRYRHALANIIARFGAKRLPKNEDESGAYYEAEQMAMIAEEALAGANDTAPTR
jgi:hypothetical protein